MRLKARRQRARIWTEKCAMLRPSSSAGGAAAEAVTMKARRVIGAVAVSLALTLASAQNASLRVIHNFGSSNDGNGPSGPLLLDSRRHLYGTTAGGPGEYGSGLVFRLTPQGPDTWGEEVLHTFGGGADGAAPKGGSESRQRRLAVK
jgi:hypothetical protein